MKFLCHRITSRNMAEALDLTVAKIMNRMWHATHQKTLAQTLGSSAPVGAGQHVHQKTRLKQSSMPLNKILQATRLRAHKQPC